MHAEAASVTMLRSDAAKSRPQVDTARTIRMRKTTATDDAFIARWALTSRASGTVPLTPTHPINRGAKS
jgi:hypothetical protein